MPKTLISGEEVMKIMDIESGKEVGDILKEIREQQLDGKITKKKEAKDFVKNLKMSS